MTRTDEQMAYARRLEELVRPVLGDRVRLAPDAEGFPIVPGRRGRIEYLGTQHGPARGGAVYAERLNVFTDRGRIIPTVPGVHHGQIGVGEARLWFEVRAMFRAVHAAALNLSAPHQLASEIWSFAVGLRHRQVAERASRLRRHLRDSVYLF